MSLSLVYLYVRVCLTGYRALCQVADKVEIGLIGARIPIEHFHRVLPSAAAITGNPGVGLQVGGVVSPHAVNLIGYLLMSSSTLGEGVARQANSDIQVH